MAAPVRSLTDQPQCVAHLVGERREAAGCVPAATRDLRAAAFGLICRGIETFPRESEGEKRGGDVVVLSGEGGASVKGDEEKAPEKEPLLLGERRQGAWERWQVTGSPENNGFGPDSDPPRFFQDCSRAILGSRRRASFFARRVVSLLRGATTVAWRLS
ncbi:hypothetical protein MTO96_035937 [Rhipicephalus appendiculatus]